MQTYHLPLIDVITHAPDVKTFRFGLDQDIAFHPGQYMILTLPIQGKDVPKALSISSSPTEKGYIECTKKLTNSEFSSALQDLPIGRECAIRFPLGKFFFEGQYPRVAFLSGGIGITPIRSIFKYATDMRLESDLVLLYSGRSIEYLTFRTDFDLMVTRNSHARVVYTLTHCDRHVAGCRIGVIDASMVKKEIPDYAQRVFYICGPPGMVTSMSSLLTDQLALPASQVVTENFVGY